MIQIKRVYEPPSAGDGFRILVDRLWPRGLSKGRARLDLWERDLAPSDSLRKWFNHDPDRWSEFRERYRGELRGKKDELNTLRTLARSKGQITLLFAARDERHNNAVILRFVLQDREAVPGRRSGSRRAGSREKAPAKTAGVRRRSRDPRSAV